MLKALVAKTLVVAINEKYPNAAFKLLTSRS